MGHQPNDVFPFFIEPLLRMKECGIGSPFLFAFRNTINVFGSQNKSNLYKGDINLYS